jgi:1-acyl-sn-glycerol-3-phosphate acyltransferase
MSNVRAVIRSAGFIVVTVGLYSIYLLGRSLLFLVNANPTRWRTGMVRRWAQACGSIIQLETNIEGTPPDPPFLLVSNHLSYVDILPFFMAMDCVFVAKNEVKSWPVLGRMAAGINIIFIDRETKRDIPRVNRLIEKNINSHQGIVIFPEGTTTKGDRVKKFNSSLLEYAASRNFPVSYSSITYCTNDPGRPAHEWVCWWGDMTFVTHFFNMLKLSSIQATVRFGEHKIQDKDRKRLAKSLHERVQQQFTPIAKENYDIYG